MATLLTGILPDAPASPSRALAATPERYEQVPGYQVRPDWDSTPVAVPPAWVRERAMLPRKLQCASFAEGPSLHYPPELLTLGRAYVADWVRLRAHGLGVTLAGAPNRSKTWAAAAMLNEITLRYASHYDLSTCWLSTFWSVPQILDARHFSQDERYYFLRNRAHDADLLVVDDLLAAARQEGGRALLWSLYEYRNQHQKPTITTLATRAPDLAGTWKSVERLFGKSFQMKLQETSQGRVLYLA